VLDTNVLSELTKPRPGARVLKWLNELDEDRSFIPVVSVEERVAMGWGDLMGAAKRNRRGLSSMDGLIAATAIAHDLALATRNTKDFEGLGIHLIDPWGA